VRKLIALVLVLAVLLGVLSIIDVVVREGVQSAMSDRIESKLPGSHADVKISSFPFLGHLAASGTVPSLQADVTDVTAGDLRFDYVDLHITDLKVDRSKLFHGTVEPLSIARGRVVADLSQSSIDSLVHLPIHLGAGTVSAAGVSVSVDVSIVNDAVVVAPGHGLPSINVPIPVLDILPCVGSARIVPGALRLSCRFHTLPGLLSHTTFHG
jgi:hypothetical protein